MWTLDTSARDSGLVMSLSSLQILFHSSRDTCSTCLSPFASLSCTAVTKRIADNEPVIRTPEITNLFHVLWQFICLLGWGLPLLNIASNGSAGVCRGTLKYCAERLKSFAMYRNLLGTKPGGLLPVKESLLHDGNKANSAICQIHLRWF